MFISPWSLFLYASILVAGFLAGSIKWGPAVRTGPWQSSSSVINPAQLGSQGSCSLNSAGWKENCRAFNRHHCARRSVTGDRRSHHEPHRGMRIRHWEVQNGRLISPVHTLTHTVFFLSLTPHPFLKTPPAILLSSHQPVFNTQKSQDESLLSHLVKATRQIKTISPFVFVL